MKYHLYQKITDVFRSEIEDGLRKPGDRMPSLRELCLARNISKSTVLSAYGRLEAEGLLESRPRSGYFVKIRPRTVAPVAAQQASNPESAPLPVSTDQVVIDIMERGAAFDLLPHTEREADNIELRRCIARAYRRQSSYQQNYYDPPQGSRALRQQIVSRLHGSGSHLDCDNIAITSGCQNALLMALMASTRPGDVVAIESPGFYGAIQLIEALGLQIMELPSRPTSGVNYEAMALVLKRWNVNALIVSPCYSTPTGSCIKETDKQRILALCLDRGITIIEDDIYGELYFGLDRPRTLHSYDQSGSVLLCSSFSKCLSRDLRIGWIAHGKFKDQIKRLKIVTSLSTSSTLQTGLADYMQRGLFERHLRQKRIRLAMQCGQLQDLIPKLLPTAVSWTQPEGGLSLWLELPGPVDTTQLYRKAQTEGITITPGALFSSQQNYANFLRLSFAHAWSDERIAALKKIGKLLENA